MAEIIDDGSQPQQHLPNVSVIFGQRGADLYADRPEQGDRSVVGSTAGGGQLDPVRPSIVGVRFPGDVPAGLKSLDIAGHWSSTRSALARTGFTYQPDADAATGYVRSPKVADPVLRRILPADVAGSRQGGYLALNRFHVDGPAYGGLVGDILDAGRFLRMHLGDGQIDGQRIITSESSRAMRRLDQPGKPFDHGLGWFRRPTAGRSDWVEHFGAGAGFWNVMRLYPDRGLGVAVMTNSTTTYDFEPLFALLAGASWS